MVCHISGHLTTIHTYLPLRERMAYTRIGGVRYINNGPQALHLTVNATSERQISGCTVDTNGGQLFGDAIDRPAWRLRKKIT